MDLHNCPIYTSDEDIIRRMLERLSSGDLFEQTLNTFRKIGHTEQMSYNIDNYVNGYDDREGQIRYILDLVRDEVIGFIHIPFCYDLDPEFKRALGPKEIDLSYLFPKKKEKPVEQYEEPVQAAVSKIVEVINPRWEHRKKDEDKDEDEDEGKNESEKSPDVASIGDTVILMADIKNCPEGAEVVFDIYDMSVKPPKKVDSAKGKHNKGVGKGEWVVADKENKGEENMGEELKLEFEATARSKTSKRCEIKIKVIELIPLGHVVVYCIDNLTNDLIQNADCILKGNGIEYNGTTDEKGVFRWFDLPLDNYTLNFNVNGVQSNATVHWLRTDTKTQTIRMKQVLLSYVPRVRFMIFSI